MKSQRLNKCFICRNDIARRCLSNQFTYYQCSNCFTSQIFPQPTSEILSAYYDSFHVSQEKGGSYDWIEDRMKEDFNKKVELVQDYYKKSNIKLLDVGCGKGFFLEQCIKDKIDAEGIDVSASGIDYAINKVKVKAYQTDISKFAEQKENQNKYDVLTLWATIEHLPNPREVFSSIFKCLKPGGLFFLDTGLGNDKWEKYLCGYSQSYHAPQHLFVYSVKGLSLLLKNAGFQILKIDENFERSYLRRIIKYIRHLYICIGSFLVFVPVLGRKGFEAMKKKSNGLLVNYCK